MCMVPLSGVTGHTHMYIYIYINQSIRGNPSGCLYFLSVNSIRHRYSQRFWILIFTALTMCAIVRSALKPEYFTDYKACLAFGYSRIT